MTYSRNKGLIMLARSPVFARQTVEAVTTSSSFVMSMPASPMDFTSLASSLSDTGNPWSCKYEQNPVKNSECFHPCRTPPPLKQVCCDQPLLVLAVFGDHAVGGWNHGLIQVLVHRG